MASFTQLLSISEAGTLRFEPVTKTGTNVIDLCGSRENAVIFLGGFPYQTTFWGDVISRYFNQIDRFIIFHTILDLVPSISLPHVFLGFPSSSIVSVTFCTQISSTPSYSCPIRWLQVKAGKTPEAHPTSIWVADDDDDDDDDDDEDESESE